MRRYIGALCAAASVLPAAAAPNDAMKLSAEGAQVYVCLKSGEAAAWQLKGPDATLATADHKPAGKHFAGPTWQAEDGSRVVGEAVANSTAPKPGAVPWLVLRAKSHEGAGIMSAVTYVVRMDTSGGAAPAAGCDAGHVGAEARSPYTADYLFFRAAP